MFANRGENDWRLLLKEDPESVDYNFLLWSYSVLSEKGDTCMDERGEGEEM